MTNSQLDNANALSDKVDYSSMTKEQLISLLQQRDSQIQQLKSGYIYIVQFENDIQSNIYKMGKTSLDTFETRMANYRSKEGKVLGEIHIRRCAHVRDVLEAEQFMHTYAREQCQCKTAQRSDKSKDKCEWYIDKDECYGNVLEAFLETCCIYQIDDDDIVAKYDSAAKDALEDKLIAITQIDDVKLVPQKYFYNPDTDTVYVQNMYGKSIRQPQKSTGNYCFERLELNNYGKHKTKQVSPSTVKTIYGKVNK